LKLGGEQAVIDGSEASIGSLEHGAPQAYPQVFHIIEVARFPGRSEPEMNRTPHSQKLAFFVSFCEWFVGLAPVPDPLDPPYLCRESEWLNQAFAISTQAPLTGRLESQSSEL